ncbi:hypothetical protein [Georgenia muralis]|uniref:Uncharacterized protein n=1 Tax=Georgenia muralis TaxID=154117 RepID=A0A3N5A2Q7_9MICO|nr:hypothetical protein [Georgenia muralis]RPF26141.1 hypothetical protein EDD32_0567 [Georgenia muralis]
MSEAPRRRRHRRVIALSEVDRRRLASGEVAGEAEALHTGDPGAVAGPAAPGAAGGNDARLIEDVPPHWGRQ